MERMPSTGSCSAEKVQPLQRWETDGGSGFQEQKLEPEVAFRTQAPHETPEMSQSMLGPPSASILIKDQGPPKVLEDLEPQEDGRHMYLLGGDRAKLAFWWRTHIWSDILGFGRNYKGQAEGMVSGKKQRGRNAGEEGGKASWALYVFERTNLVSGST